MTYTSTDIYNIHINTPSVNESFMLYYAVRNIDNSISLMDQEFISKNKEYCLSLLNNIMDLPNFIGFPFPCVNFIIT
jgi:hypothetical protein